MIMLCGDQAIPSMSGHPYAIWQNNVCMTNTNNNLLCINWHAYPIYGSLELMLISRQLDIISHLKIQLICSVSWKSDRNTFPSLSLKQVRVLQKISFFYSIAILLIE
jgi:hypothetical protein